MNGTPTYVFEESREVARPNSMAFTRDLLPTGGFNCLVSEHGFEDWYESYRPIDEGHVIANMVTGRRGKVWLDDLGPSGTDLGGFFILNATLCCGAAASGPVLVFEGPGFVTEVERERQDSMALVSAIRNALPRFSEKRLGGLVGVARLTWHDWAKGKQIPRSNNRHRLLALKALLERRRALVPGEGLDEWLDTPIGAALETTPAKLLSEGRFDTVAVLASRIPRRLDVTDGLVRELPQTELLDLPAVDAGLALDRLYALDEDEDSD